MIQLSLDSINEHDVYYVMLSPRAGVRLINLL